MICAARSDRVASEADVAIPVIICLAFVVCCVLYASLTAAVVVLGFVAIAVEIAISAVKIKRYFFPVESAMNEKKSSNLTTSEANLQLTM